MAGHLHPVARVSQRGRAVSRRCFATDDNRTVMPAFGAYTGDAGPSRHVVDLAREANLLLAEATG